MNFVIALRLRAGAMLDKGETVGYKSFRITWMIKAQEFLGDE